MLTEVCRGKDRFRINYLWSIFPNAKLQSIIMDSFTKSEKVVINK